MKKQEIIGNIIILKNKLSATDYKAIKYAENEISYQDYEPIKMQRKAWREEINKLQEELLNMG